MRKPPMIPLAYPTSSTHHQNVAFIHRFTLRIIDLLGAVLGLLLLSPFFALIAYLIKHDSPGPVLYWGQRAGQNGKVFRILKFRTMYERPESYGGPKITAGSDPRITPFGRWLRDTKINELPQLYNVLKGEMSLVGPRPEDPEIVAAWPAEVRREILSVKPGVTSPAAVIYRDEENLLRSDQVIEEYLQDILPSKLRLDLLYVRNRTILTDLDVLFLTLLALLPLLRKRPVPEHLLFWGPISRFFSRYASWFVIDTIVALIAVGASGLFWRTLGPLDMGWDFAPFLAIILALLFSLLNAALGLNRVSWSKAQPAEVIDLAVSSSFGTLIVLIVNGYLGTPKLLVGLILLSGLFAFFGFVAVRYRSRLITGLATRWLNLRGAFSVVGERVLIVGAGEMGQFASWLLRYGQLAQAFQVIGMVDDDPRKDGLRIDGCNVLGRAEDIPKLVQERDIGVIIFAINRLSADRRAEILELCHQTGTRIVVLPDFLRFIQSYFPGGNGEKPGSFTLLSQKQVTAWLDDLETTVKGGDLGELSAKIRAYRERLEEPIS